MSGRDNNFDLVRLVAALQVVVSHGIEFIHPDVPRALEPVVTVFRWFPGVPVFFALSGYLLAGSLDRNSNLVHYARNRALRIFPGLWACLAGTLVLLAAAGLLFDLSPLKLVIFLAAQATIGQSWAPFPISEYGLGSPYTPNPALWTIRVEVGFYLILPVLLLGGRALLRTARRVDQALVAAAVVSFVIYAAWGNPDVSDAGYPLLLRLLVNSPAPFLWYFLVGVLLHRHDGRSRSLLRGRTVAWTGAFLAARALVYLAWEANGGAPPLAALGGANLVLVAPAFALGFSPSPVVVRLRPRGDISYGVYLWHMVLINAFVHWDLVAGWSAVVATFVGAVAVAFVSWHLVEAPALARKGASARRAARDQAAVGPGAPAT